jgi:hypothetical protein
MADELAGLLVLTELLALAALMAGVVGLLVWAILRAAQHQPQAMLVVVLGVLAIVAAMGYLVGGDERAELVTLAATAVGALAGALTMLTRPQGPTDGPLAGPGGPQPPGVAPDTTPAPSVAPGLFSEPTDESEDDA